MNQPSEEDDPHHSRKYELNERHEQAALQQLSQTGNEKTAQRCDDISG